MSSEHVCNKHSLYRSPKLIIDNIELENNNRWGTYEKN